MNEFDRLGLIAASPTSEDRTNPRDRPVSWWGMLVASVAMTWAFYHIYSLDVPIAHFVRSLQHPLGYILDPWMAAVSAWGDWLGGGVQLVALSVSCWVVGRALGWVAWELAGLQSLLAHAIVAIVTNLMKRSIGRPRPKFSHSGEFQLWPSLDNGFDSFPSGHASASFAVATVLGAHFPRTRWLWYGLAAAIAVSRVLRSAHFPTDVIAAAALGSVVGWLLSHPLSHWRQSLATSILAGAPWLVGLCGVLWIATRPVDRTTAELVVFSAGTLLTLLGIVCRLYAESLNGPFQRSTRSWTAIAWTGVLLSTGSVLIFTLGWMVLLGRWLSDASGGCAPIDPHGRSWRHYRSEAILAGGLLGGLLVVWKLPGVLPFR